jgi:hypothetical protein
MRKITILKKLSFRAKPKILERLWNSKYLKWNNKFWKILWVFIFNSLRSELINEQIGYRETNVPTNHWIKSLNKCKPNVWKCVFINPWNWRLVLLILIKLTSS